MKLRFLLLFSPFLFLFACSNSSSHQEYHPLAESPGPSDEDDPLRDSLKQVFLDQLYFAEEGLNVDSIRHANRLLHRAIKQEQRQKANPRSASEFFANDNIEAIWHERGPDNEAGDIKIVDYVPSLDRLYAISSVGHLWRGSTAGDDWELLNDDIQLETNIIRVLPHNGGTRIFACYGAGTEDKEVRYSDDEGVTWTKGTGFDFYDHWGAARRLYALSDGQTLYYLVHTWSASPWGQLMQIYKSTDKGQTYSQIVETPVGYETDEMDMWKPYDSDLLYVIDNEAKEYFRINHNFATGSSSISTPVSYSNQGIANGRIHVSGRQGSSATRYDLYIYHSSNDNVYKTTNGSNWTFLSQASDNVWRRGWLADPHNDNLYVGSFQLNKTTDLINWEEQYDRWWEYYSVSKDSMHVDIMSLDYFEKSDGTPFITICNHAGIHITYDHFKTTENLAWTSLQVTTLYDQTTASDGFLYCGAQDKGTFVYRGNSQADYSILSTQNTTTGDGMIGSFFNSDQSYYSMIQNGQFACIPNRETSQKTWYTIPGNHKSGWINPMVATPKFTDNAVYMAGGNLNGGNGCYLILMDVNISNGINFNPTQFNYNFRANSDNGTSVIKAIGVSPSDESRLYVATQDATFFYSENGGTNWTKSAANLPSSMIPWEIITSAGDPDYVIISGTGFSNTGVYLSTDGGDSFTALSTDIPAATFYEIALSDDEKYLYAATSEGPYVYSFDEARWYDLIGADSPILDYTSVDNIGNSTIRFGTYGRGVWDFEITSSPLPAELIAFTALPEGKDAARLDWVTASEIGTKEFIIAHSEDGTQFKAIGSVAAAGWSQATQEYHFIHQDLQTQKNYYRLEMVEEDHSVEYSEIRVVSLDALSTAFAVFPNPVAQNSALSIRTAFEGDYRLEIYDGNGRMVYTEVLREQEATLSVDLAKGLYWVNLVDNRGQKTLQKKLVVF